MYRWSGEVQVKLDIGGQHFISAAHAAQPSQKASGENV